MLMPACQITIETKLISGLHYRVASDTGMYWDVLHVLGKKLCTSKCTEKRLFFSSVLGNVLGFFLVLK